MKKPYFSVRGDARDAEAEFVQASLMLHQAVLLALSASGDGIPEHIRKILQERADVWESAAVGG